MMINKHMCIYVYTHRPFPASPFARCENLLRHPARALPVQFVDVDAYVYICVYTYIYTHTYVDVYVYV